MKPSKRKIYIHEFLPPQKPQKDILEPLAEIVLGGTRDEEELIRLLSGVDGVLVTLTVRLTRRVLESAPHLKVIGRYGVGVENVDIEAATDVGIPVLNVPGVNASAVAELTIGLMLAVMRGIQFSKPHIAGGHWRDPLLIGSELRNSTVGLIGFGNIARRVIRILSGFDLKKILVYSEHKPDPGESKLVEFVELPELLAEADVVSIHKALTDKSRGLIGEKELQTMKPTAWLINTSRGGLIREEALIKAIENHWIAGAALDVFDREPLPADSPLLSFRNVVTTPHIGGSTMQTRLKSLTKAAQNVADILMGNSPDMECVRNPEVLIQSTGEKK